MINGYWESIPTEYIREWRNIFADSREGADLSACCPVCHNKKLHRYYQMGRMIKSAKNGEENVPRGSEWQWCSYCRIFEHAEVVVPDWWIPNLEIDGNKLTAIPEILDMAYQDEKRVNKWKNVPEQCLETWDKIFNQNPGEDTLGERCPVCNKKMLRQYYTLAIPGPILYKKKRYKGQGAHWEWCGACFRYKFSHSCPVPLNWDYKLEIEPWKFMTIPEPINEKIRLNE